ncbi:regulator of G-protein signaling 3 isoform X9, partial [Sigmodon hispidus]
MAAKAKKIFAEFIAIQACGGAQKRIFGLMEKDSHPRFLRSDLCLDLISQKKFTCS